MKDIKAIVYGVGRMGGRLTRFMVEKGVKIVGAIDVNPDIVDKDLGEVVGLGSPLNVRISNNADVVLSEQQADIAVLAVVSDMERMYPHIKKCVENGLNVISTAREVGYGWIVSPVLTSKVDRLARRHGVTVAGSGFQDVFLINLVSLLTGGIEKIKTITHRGRSNLNESGPLAVGEYHVGRTEEEFYKALKENRVVPSALTRHVECLIAGLGLTLTTVQHNVRPILADVDIKCKCIGETVKKGRIIGLSRSDVFDTAEGIRIVTERDAKVYKPGEVNLTQWSIEGVPALDLTLDVDDAEATAATIVYRIPDVINSEPGYVTVDQLPKLKFRVSPLHYYVTGTKSL
jgi:hypothetical protein